MSNVRFGGLGKTTLANKVYREVGGKLALVSISQNPNIIKLLNRLIKPLRLHPKTFLVPWIEHVMDELFISTCGFWNTGAGYNYITLAAVNYVHLSQN
jgi:hypothetical protein